MMRMFRILRNAYVAISVLISASGCVHSKDKHLVLRTDRLFRDAVGGKKEDVSDYDCLVFRSEGSEVYGQVLKPAREYGEDRPCVIFLHGFAGFVRFDDVGQALCQAGCVVVIPHHRGAWGSQGKYSISNCIQDAVNLVRHVREPSFRRKYHVGAEAVFLVGHSMGGNTVLNAAGRTEGVRGVVLLDPCDIGSMARRWTSDMVKDFLIENGLDILRTDGVEAVYDDLVQHADEYAFPKSVTRLRHTSLFLVSGTWGIDESGLFLPDLCSASEKNKDIPFFCQHTYPCKHGLMGARIDIARIIADFICKTLRSK